MSLLLLKNKSRTFLQNPVQRCGMHIITMNLFKKILFSLSLIFLSAPYLVWAESLPQELYISTKGIATARGAEVKIIHALNLFSVSIWGQKWTVSTDYTTKFESSEGAEIKPEKIAVGHILEVRGRPSRATEGTIEASLIRDLSIGAGSSVSASLLDSICPVATPVPSPVSVSGSLTHTLSLGSRGAEVSFLQQFLQTKGFGIPSDGVTGYFGKVTEQAVKDFQQKNALEAAGIVGAKTRAIINSLIGR